MQLRAKIILEGIVQGVGFRPFVHRLAKCYNLSGWVLNSNQGIIIEVEGTKDNIQVFYQKLISSPPPLATILRNSIEFHQAIGLKSFKIKKSESTENEFTPVSPDIGTCKDCYQELFNPTDRRYMYPFINCTNCGPRFTIIEGIPYDREKTTMKKFKMCKECQSEYEDISNRRYHAQPNACKVCGPKVWLNKNGKEVLCVFPIKEAINLIKAGYIVAVKGLGGFHLACNALDSQAVERLRKRKKREKSKPFAIMCPNIEMIKKYCKVSEEEENLLTSPQRPIVLLQRKKDCPISENVAPKNKYLGIMLPYTPLHYLLFFQSPIPLVMTSANLSDEPLTKDNLEAVKRLSGIADYILMHNRDIYNRCDDSVTQIVQGKELIIRRSRGYAPFPIRVNFNLKPTLAVGAELKNTFCLAKRNLAFISQHIGDLRNLETLEFFKEAIKRYKRLFLIEPEIIAYDLHPDYLSTKFAKEYSSYNTCFSLLPVQHHHAHIASCMAENGLLNEEVIGVAWDGIGYGTDGKIWGGEFMLASYSHFERVGHFKYIPMPGADKATEEPYRMGISYLYSVFGKDFINLKLDFIQRLNKQKVDILLRMIDLGINSPLTSSVGRLFDAVSAILGVCDKVDYEAQAAVELEMLIKDEVIEEYKYEIILDNDIFIINPSFIIEGIIRDIVDKIPSFIISCKFHNTLVSIIEKMCVKLREKYKLNKVVLSGGVFQNRYLIEKLLPRLKALGFICFRHSKVPPNDGGISLGQVVIANHKDVLGNTSRDN